MLRGGGDRPFVCNPDDFVADSLNNTIDIRVGHPLRYVLEVVPGTIGVDEIKELWLPAEREP